ncbi:MAG: Lrp/AsnC family transcriptional regulator [Dehalococcoidia bacterium]|nr:Lrp/AsnC family transcriptional regulator [Dehalococcoidia bacterium]
MATVGRIDDQLDRVDKLVLNALQSDFPLVPRPFAVLGGRLGLTEAEALELTKKLKESGVIRQISAIFDSRALGYQSTLAAMQVPDERLDAVAAAVSEESGVSHNYARSHTYNLWFTLTVPPGVDTREALSRVAARVVIDKYLFLPAIRVFKIGVRLNMLESDDAGGDRGHELSDKSQATVPRLPAPDCLRLPPDPSLVRELQKDIEIVERPFSAVAAALGMSEEDLLMAARHLEAAGVMRRFAAVLRHRQAGFSANGMGAWVVPEETIEEVGPIMASFPQVTHCYQRPSYPDWPYNMFTMIHARSRPECEAIAAEIADKTGIGEYRILYSTKEYKKVRVKYFE